MKPAGWYRDTIFSRGIVEWQSACWRKNLIVSTAWPLVAGLLKNDPELAGIRYCAVGEGDQSWDKIRHAVEPETIRLYREVTRVPVDPSDIRYVDATGHPVSTPTHRLELTVTVPPAPQPRQLREFGLVGGRPTSAIGSGSLINYAVHPVIELRPQRSLTRRIRLSFRPAGHAAPEQVPDVPLHWLGKEPVTFIDGVGATAAKTLTNAGVTNIGQLAAMELAAPLGKLSAARSVELRAKARLALQAATQLPRETGLSSKTFDEALAIAPGDLASAEELERLQGLLGLLQITLDARRLHHLTVAELASPSPPDH